MPDDLEIQYRFRLPRQAAQTDVTLRFDAEEFEMRLPPEAPAPAWTDLTFSQCPNCPLDPAQHSACPAALRLASIVPQFEEVVSFDELHLTVITPEREVVATTSAQQALSSLIGLVMASSGCPRTRIFRLMARYHLPLASEEETTIRVLGTHALREYSSAGQSLSEGLAPLVEQYRELRVVNQAMARRLGAAGRTDSTLNAVVILDLFAITVPAAIEEAFESFGPLL